MPSLEGVKSPACGHEDEAGGGACRHCAGAMLDLAVAPTLKTEGGGDTVPASAPTPPPAIAGLEVIRLLGQGGMGAVWLARDQALQRLVAVKRISTDRAGGTSARQRFLREARAMASIEHAHVVRVHSFAETEGEPYVVMEYVEGETLAARLRREGTLPEKEALRLTSEVTQALAAAWEKGIVHRDVKPGNILLDREGQVRVADFGLSRPAETGPEPLTQVGLVVGTPFYASPEQRAGLAVDFRSDLYSLGVVLKEMLAGRSGAAGGRTPRARPDGLHLMAWMTAEEPSARPGSHAELLRAIAELGAAPKRRSRSWLALGAAATLLGAGVAVVALARVGAAPEPGMAPAEDAAPRPVMLAVLPFANLGRSEDAYFADGITDEIGARLARIRGLGVIARSSAARHSGAALNLRAVAEDLGVEYILEGTVRWEHQEGSSRVRVTPELVRASDGTRLWTEVYDEPLAGIFQLQARIAERVAEALDLTVVEPGRRAQAATNPEAYELYLRGNEYLRRGRSGLELAERVYERAVELDPSFALAHVGLADTHMSRRRARKAKEAIDRAVAIDPELPEARLALGDYYYRGYGSESGHRDHRRALAEFEWVRARMPGSSRALKMIGRIHRHQDRWREAVEILAEAVRLDPRDSDALTDLGWTHLLMRDFAATQLALERGLALNPEDEVAYQFLAQTHVARNGATREAREVLIALSRLPTFAASSESNFWLAVMDLFDRDFEGALRRLAPDRVENAELKEFFRESLKVKLLRAVAYERLSRGADARAEFEALRPALEDLLHSHPDAPNIHGMLGVALAGLGRRQEALDAGKRAVELLPVERDAVDGRTPLAFLAMIHARIGEPEAAVELLERLLSRPSDVFVNWLRVDPTWDPLRGHPEFERLLERYR
jgi:TolB-like protein/Tfp pilus assembly protein PilF